MPGSSDLDHILAAIKAQVDALHTHEAGAPSGRHPEDVHQVRVAVRRLRAILRVSRSLFDPKWVDGLRRELKWLGTALGRVRDLDVLHAYLRSSARGAAPLESPRSSGPPAPASPPMPSAPGVAGVRVWYLMSR